MESEPSIRGLRMTVDTVAWLIYGCARHGREGEVELWDCQHFGGLQAFPGSQQPRYSRPTKDPNREMRPVGGREGSPASKWAVWRESQQAALRAGETQVPRYR